MVSHASGSQASGTNINGLAIAAGLAVFAAAFIGPNKALVAYAAFVLVVGLTLLWRPDEMPVMVFVFCYQWLQAATGPIYGNFFGLSVSDLTQNLGQHDRACFLELTAVLLLAVGMRLGVGRGNLDLRFRIQS